MNNINTIYIISKGRPHCITAQTLSKMGYTGEWYIVCGNNDETIPEYQKNWGSDKILIFDWYEEVKHTDFLDNFGYENKSSGAIPVRNATRKISEDRGELRHWQFDDDYTAFYHIDKNLKKWKKPTGSQFESSLYRIANFAHNAKLTNVGFAVASDSRPSTVKDYSKRVFNAHNMSNDINLFTKWRGRLNDDVINAIETYQKGKREMSFKYMNMILKPTQSEKGGNTEIYQEDGTVRKTAYSILIDPKNVKLTIKHGRYHHKVDWKNLFPKLIHENYGV
jgi:hypothetical protein